MQATDYKIGFGTWELGEDSYSATYAALEAGYRFIDTAMIYRNEKEVGQAIRDWLKNNHKPRKEVFVQTKLWDTDVNYPRIAFQRSLERLGLDYVDSYLIHHAGLNFLSILHAWQQMVIFQKEGLTKHIGVSNFDKEHIMALFQNTKVKPWTNQIESHPQNIRWDRLRFLKSQKINIQAYTPLGRNLFNNELLVKIATQHGVSTSVIMLAFARALDLVPIVRSRSKGHIVENLGSLKVELTKAEVDEISTLNCYQNVCPELFNWPK